MAECILKNNDITKFDIIPVGGAIFPTMSQSHKNLLFVADAAANKLERLFIYNFFWLV